MSWWGTVKCIGLQQKRILEALQGRKSITNQELHTILYGVPEPFRQRRRGHALTASQRASLSRSLRILREHGVIRQPHKENPGLRPCVELTDWGKEFSAHLLEST